MAALTADTLRKLKIACANDAAALNVQDEVDSSAKTDEANTFTSAQTLAGLTCTTLTASGAAALQSTLAVTGVITPTGGIATAEGLSSPRCCHTGSVPATATTHGTNAATNSANTVYLSELFVPCNMSVTGVQIFNGTAVAGNGKFMLYKVDSAGTTGTRVAVTASTAMSGATAYQLVAFTGGPIAIEGPATYFIGAIYDDTSHDLRGHTLGSFATGTFATSVVYATDSTMATVTTPTTFAVTTGPIASLY